MKTELYTKSAKTKGEEKVYLNSEVDLFYGNERKLWIEKQFY